MHCFLFLFFLFMCCFFYLQVSQPVRKRRPRRRQGNLRWMRLYRFTGGTVMRRCTLAATSTQVAESTCSSSTTPTHSGAPRVFTTESTIPDKPEYRHKGSQGVCMFAYINICMYVCVFVRGGGWRFVWRQPVFVCMCACVRRRKLPDLFWVKPPEGDKETHLES